MALLPQKTGAGSVTDANTTVAQQITNFGSWLQFLIDLFGTGDASTARATVTDVALGAGVATPSVNINGASATIDFAAYPANRLLHVATALTFGTGSVISFGTLPNGTERDLRAVGIPNDVSLLLLHNATSLICPGGQNLRLYSGDVVKLVSLGSGNWRVSRITRAWGPDVDLVTWRNRLINGDMRIDQRNAGGSVTPTATAYIVDRWQLSISQASKITAGRNLGAGSPPAGFTNYLGFATAAAYAPGAGEQFCFVQPIEGVNVGDLGWGTAAAQPITVSFPYYSSLTGTHSGSVRNGALNRSYPFTFAVNAANTWEWKTITIPGDTAGTWATDNTAGLLLSIDLGSGSSMRGAAGAWAAANYVGATGAVSPVGTLSATVRATGMQLEAGAAPTPFERREYSSEFARCQRYYQTRSINARQKSIASNDCLDFTLVLCLMRATPTSALLTAGSNANVGALSIGPATPDSVRVELVSAAAGDCFSIGALYSFTSEL